MRLYRRQRNRAVLAGRALLTCSGVNRAASTDPAPALEGASPNGLGLAGTKVLSAANLHALAFQSSFQSSAAPLAPKKVKFSQTATLENPRAEMTSVLKFHAFEPYLAVVDDEAGVSLWAYEQGRCDFRWEANRKTDERVTTLEWLNASTTSLLLCGSDDGVVSVWGGFDLDCDKEFQGLVGQAPCVPRTPTLVSAFVAADDLSKGSRSSGLVTAWHKASATLFAAGHSPHVRVWDLASEALSATVQTTTDACVTSMASSNRCTVFAGFGDGSLRLFDTRALGGKAALRFGREHSGWIVHTSERAPHEVASGCVAGDLRFWDVRKPDESYRLVDVQTSTMTALVAHESAPLLMSGSHNQFIKFLTRSGEQLNVVRYHDGFLGQRIGPVSALAFHPNKLVCAAGSTDAIIGLYAA